METESRPTKVTYNEQGFSQLEIRKKVIKHKADSLFTNEDINKPRKRSKERKTHRMCKKVAMNKGRKQNFSPEYGQ